MADDIAQFRAAGSRSNTQQNSSFSRMHSTAVVGKPRLGRDRQLTALELPLKIRNVGAVQQRIDLRSRGQAAAAARLHPAA
jgi:hypothetical protein